MLLFPSHHYQYFYMVIVEGNSVLHSLNQILC